MCVGCRQRAAKTALLRVVAAPAEDGLSVVPDPAGTAPGRGAHLHPDPRCLEQAVRRQAFARALRVTGGLDIAPLRDHLGGPQHPTSTTEADIRPPDRRGSSSS